MAPATNCPSAPMFQAAQQQRDGFDQRFRDAEFAAERAS